MSNRGVSLTGKRLATAQKNVLIAMDVRKNDPVVRAKWILKMKEVQTGTANSAWIEDRSMVVNQEERVGYKHSVWSQGVKNRDGWKCQISNSDCSGRLEAHHILSWRDFPELRFIINNGIALCHAHHPRVRSESLL
jgi:hypothetical protein